MASSLFQFDFFYTQDKDNVSNYECSAYLGSDVYNNSDQQTCNTNPTTPAPKPRPLSKSEYRKMQEQVAVWDFYCRQTYYMSALALEHMMHLGYDDFLNKILGDERYSNEIIRTLWQTYLDRYICKRQKLVAQYTQRIDRALKQRDEKKIQEELKKQEIAKDVKRLLKVYDDVMLSNKDFNSLHKLSCQKALLQTKLEEFAKHTRSYTLDEQTIGMLQAHGVNYQEYQSLSGTIFQHELFQEGVECYQKVAKIIFGYGIKNSCLVAYVVDLVQAACQATKHESFFLSIQLQDLADILAEVTLAQCKGVIESVAHLTDMVLHPKETAKQISKAVISILQTLGGALSQYDENPSVFVCNQEIAAQAFDSDIQAFNQMCNLSKQAFAQWWELSSQKDKIQALSKLQADVIIQPIVIGKVGKATWELLQKGWELAMFDGLAELENVVQKTAQEQTLITSIGDIETSIVSLMEEESHAVTTKLLPSSLNLSEVSAIAKRQEIVRKIESIMQLVMPEIRILVQERAIFFIDFEGMSQSISIDITHIFIPEIKFRWNYDLVKNIRICEEFGLAGWHYGCLKEFEQVGLIKILKKITKNDCIYVECICDYAKTPIKKTLYPESWSKEKVINAIKQAVSQPYKIISKGDPKNCLEKTLYSKIEDNIEIVSYLKRESITQDWCVKSSFVNKDWILS